MRRGAGPKLSVRVCCIRLRVSAAPRHGAPSNRELNSGDELSFDGIRRCRFPSLRPGAVFRLRHMLSRAGRFFLAWHRQRSSSPIRLAAVRGGSWNAAPANLPFSTAWLMTTARSRPVALTTVARRCAGELMRKSSFENSSSLPGQGGERCNLLHRDDAAVDDPQLEGELRVVLDPGRECLRQRNRVTRGVCNG